MLTMYGSHMSHSAMCMVHMQPQRTAWNVAFVTVFCFNNCCIRPEICVESRSMLQYPYTLTMHGSHMSIQIPSLYTQFLTWNNQKSTWKSLHVSDNIVYSQICHKYIHVMGWKEQRRKETATCGKFVSLSSCCEQPAAGMFRAFPVHFVPMQWNRKLCNMHDSHVAPENVCLIKLYGTLVACHLKSVKNVWNVHVATNSSLLQSPQNPQKCVKRVW